MNFPRERWQDTVKHSSLADLQRAVKFNGPSSPCISGCRSICWKTFLLGHGSDTTSWTHALLESRSTYASLRDHFLKYIDHPEYLAAVNTDPLADDPDVCHAPVFLRAPSHHAKKYIC